MSQKLKSLEKILLSIDNDVELSYNKNPRILVKDNLNIDNL